MTRIAVLLPTKGRAQQAAQRVKALRSQPLQWGILLQVVMAIPADDRATLTVARQLSHEPSPVAVQTATPRAVAQGRRSDRN